LALSFYYCPGKKAGAEAKKDREKPPKLPPARFPQRDAEEKGPPGLNGISPLFEKKDHRLIWRGEGLLARAWENFAMRIRK
jgi:hypothetical protein